MNKVNCFIEENSIFKINKICEFTKEVSQRVLIVIDRYKVTRCSEILQEKGLNVFSIKDDSVVFTNITVDQDAFNKIKEEVIVISSDLFFKLVNKRKIKDSYNLNDFDFEYIIFEDVDINNTSFDENHFFKMIEQLEKEIKSTKVFYFDYEKYELLNIIYYIARLKYSGRLKLLNIKTYRDFEDIFVEKNIEIVDEKGKEILVKKYRNISLLCKLFDFNILQNKKSFIAKEKVYIDKNVLIENIIKEYNNNIFQLVVYDNGKKKVAYYSLNNLHDEEIVSELLKHKIPLNEIKYFDIVSDEEFVNINFINDKIKILFIDIKYLDKIYYLKDKIKYTHIYISNREEYLKNIYDKKAKISSSKNLLVEMQNIENDENKSEYVKLLIKKYEQLMHKINQNIEDVLDE